MTTHEPPSRPKPETVHNVLEPKANWLNGVLQRLFEQSVLVGSWVVIFTVVSRTTIVIPDVGGLEAPLVTCHEPPSSPLLAQLMLSLLLFGMLVG